MIRKREENPEVFGMEVTSHCNTSDVTEGGANKDPNQSECIASKPTSNGTLPHHSSEETPPPPSDRSEDADSSSDDSLTDSSSTTDISRLLPTSVPQKQKGADSSSASPPPICTPPSSSFTSPPRRPPSCSGHRHHQTTNQKRLSSTKSHASFKTDAAHIKEVAGDEHAHTPPALPVLPAPAALVPTNHALPDPQHPAARHIDCCVHCVLACLFCELLSMCSAVGECLACGVGGAGCCDATAGCCCCVEAAGEAACTEEACQAVLDCGILENCCGSSDCLEICLECCSICFPS